MSRRQHVQKPRQRQAVTQQCWQSVRSARRTIEMIEILGPDGVREQLKELGRIGEQAKCLAEQQ